MSAIDLTLEHISHLNASYGVSIPLIVIEPFGRSLNIEADNQPRNVPLIRLKSAKFPRLHPDTLLPIPTSAEEPSSCWYSPESGDVFDCLRRHGVLDKLIQDGKEYIFVSSGNDVGALYVCFSSRWY
jgi:UTP--glucose-1-phosphate uridylyltransferase